MDLAAIQTRLSDLVKASTLLTDRPVLIEDKGNLVAELEAALAVQSLAVVVALSGGKAKDNAQPKREIWVENFEVVIHRGALDGVDVPSTLSVLLDLRKRVHGAGLHATDRAQGTFTCTQHDLRDGGDGSYCRVLTVTVNTTVTSTP